MIDYVLVTVRYDNKIEKDMEIPAQLDVRKIADMLLESLQTAEPLLFSEKEKIQIKYKNKVISNGTLFDNKIWDGSILEIIS